ncbi:methylated-DNA--[protein]-cysteine S-methyltransferase [Psittacicella hinzii]|uniref:methylated-DNA--[protein]-cysteine S-methyltransferase n=1 Tax=Psittacicella hinzii TaxID=2028575 RepID=UPI00223B33EF|nr:methylated-DNA--[protein]-cysteine S-methyltransferase [Psittacicella hinzii]
MKSIKPELYIGTYSSPVGELTLVVYDNSLWRVYFASELADKVAELTKSVLNKEFYADESKGKCDKGIDIREVVVSEFVKSAGKLKSTSNNSSKVEESIKINKRQALSKETETSIISASRVNQPKYLNREEVDLRWVDDLNQHEVLNRVRDCLDKYFAGERVDFTSIAYSLCGTEFQLQVWQALTLIPYGCSTSYGEIAKRINRPKAVRAVAQAIGANPLPIVIPCHRDR